MAPKLFVSDIRPQQDVESTFIVAEKQLRTARTGTAFLTLRLVDRTGEVTGRIWDDAESIADLIAVKSPVFLRGRSELYRDELQLNIASISPLPLDGINAADFLPVCPVSIEILSEKMKKLLSGLKRPSFKALARVFLSDRALIERFKTAPAAKSMHHAYLGGLLEHSASVIELACRISDHYPELDRDMLIMGGFLHDIGKVDEFVYDICIDYSHEGKLVGHMILGAQILEEKVRSMKGFPLEEAVVLKHLILSHHGQAEFGAAKLPMTKEALVLHHADDMDAKMNCLSRLFSEIKDDADGWTPFQPLFQRFFFRGFPSISSADLPSLSENEEERGRQLSLWSNDRVK